jgi:hypothetical protein
MPFFAENWQLAIATLTPDQRTVFQALHKVSVPEPISNAQVRHENSSKGAFIQTRRLVDRLVDRLVEILVDFQLTEQKMPTAKMSNSSKAIYLLPTCQKTNYVLASS